jgi:hypothetical protein
MVICVAQRYYHSSRKKLILAGSKLSHRPSGLGLGLELDEWDSIVAANQAHFGTVGEVIAYFLHQSGSVKRPRLMHVLMQSLLWFGEGCREVIDPMAIVKFTAAMDALTLGKEENGICQLLEERCGLKPQQVFSVSRNMTVRKVVEKVYREGRSRTVHGTNDKLLVDWTEVRYYSEVLARHCLVGSLHWAAMNPSSDDPMKLLGN